jgi:alpha/beta superfamily hydrolase
VKAYKPDLLVGSSFGGGIAARLLKEGLYKGPAILLAPAAKKLFGIESLGQNDVTIIHGARDDVVPLEDSYRLLTRSSAPWRFGLIVVQDDHRLGKAGTQALIAITKMHKASAVDGRVGGQDG